jgi:hypothetical protein
MKIRLLAGQSTSTIVRDSGILPAKTPQMTVDIRGVLVLEFMFDKNLKSKPSLAIAYKMRGSGNIAPKRL